MGLIDQMADRPNNPDDLIGLTIRMIRMVMGNGPNGPDGLVTGKDRDGDGRDDTTGIVQNYQSRPSSSFISEHPFSHAAGPETD